MAVISTVLIAVVCLLIGVALGSLLTRALSPQEKKCRELEDKLQNAEDQHQAYQQEVAEHFIKTSSLLRNMTENYRDLGEHLASGAMTLSSTDVSRQVINATNPQLADNSPDSALSSVAAEPPKDYAPSVPGGVLSENYGFTPDIADGATLATRGIASGPGVLQSNIGDNDEDEDPTLKVG